MGYFDENCLSEVQVQFSVRKSRFAKVIIRVLSTVILSLVRYHHAISKFGGWGCGILTYILEFVGSIFLHPGYLKVDGLARGHDATV